jgi:hypothetical protein
MQLCPTLMLFVDLCCSVEGHSSRGKVLAQLLQCVVGRMLLTDAICIHKGNEAMDNDHPCVLLRSRQSSSSRNRSGSARVYNARFRRPGGRRLPNTY